MHKHQQSTPIIAAELKTEINHPFFRLFLFPFSLPSSHTTKNPFSHPRKETLNHYANYTRCLYGRGRDILRILNTLIHIVASLTFLYHAYKLLLTIVATTLPILLTPPQHKPFCHHNGHTRQKPRTITL